MTEESWCVIYDYGKFDGIIVDSADYRVCRSYVANLQHMYDKPLNIVLKEEVRYLHEFWKPVEFCTGGTVCIPGGRHERK
jgi:hypothetical protein